MVVVEEQEEEVERSIHGLLSQPATTMAVISPHTPAEVVVMFSAVVTPSVAVAVAAVAAVLVVVVGLFVVVG